MVRGLSGFVRDPSTGLHERRGTGLKGGCLMRTVWVIAGVLMTLLAVTAANADTVFLKNGETIWGRDVFEEGDVVIIERPGGEIRVPKGEVTGIERVRSSLPPYYVPPVSPSAPATVAPVPPVAPALPAAPGPAESPAPPATAGGPGAPPPLPGVVAPPVPSPGAGPTQLPPPPPPPMPGTLPAR
jgi:hypothetical protein